MSKATAVTLTAILFFSSASVFAQGAPDKDAGQMNMDKGGMMGGGMMGKGMMGKEMMGMMKMHKMMGNMQNEVVATSDGGIVIVGGNKITKYDKDLNVVKEAEFKQNTEAMQKMMNEMMAKCPMMGKGMAAEEAAPASEVDHASHH